MSRQRIPMPSDAVLEEVAERYRITPDALRRELENPCPPVNDWGTWTDLEGAAASVRKQNQAIRAVAERQANARMKLLHALAAEYGVSWSDIVREEREGDWPSAERAARALRDRREAREEAVCRRLPRWLHWLRWLV